MDLNVAEHIYQLLIQYIRHQNYYITLYWYHISYDLCVCVGGGGGGGNCLCLRVNSKLFFFQSSPSTLLTRHTSNVELVQYRIY